MRLRQAAAQGMRSVRNANHHGIVFFAAAIVAGIHFGLFAGTQVKRSKGQGTLGRRRFVWRIPTATACESD
jgi:hypothetical protein